MKKVVIVLLCAMLAGCITDQPQTEVTVNRVVEPPTSLYQCPSISTWPNAATLTDLEVAQTMLKLAEARNICASSLNAIRNYIAAAKSKIAPPKKK